MEEREARIARWFSMWLQGNEEGLDELFAPDAVYVESWGPEYHGADKIRHWFREWNTRGRVLAWDIGQYFHKGDQTVVEWRFQCRMEGQAPQGFDGLSLLRWTPEGKIAFLKEFGCVSDTYDPYRNGPVPEFRS